MARPKNAKRASRRIAEPEIKPAAVIGVREAAFSTERSSYKKFLRILGPGIIVGASDDDPSGIGTYSIAGATLGFSTLWTALITFPMMAAVQFICAKIGLVTGKGLAAVLKQHYSKALLYPVVVGLLIANTINAGADIGAIAAALNLLIPIRIIALIVPISLTLIALQLWGSYKTIAKTFKWLCLALFAYIGAALFAHPSLREVLRGTFFPSVHWNADYLSTLVAILGTTISPYMFFWQANQEVEEDIAMGRTYSWQRKGTTDQELKYAALDVNIGMLFSNVVMYFIIVATAATLFKSGHRNIQTAADAAAALVPLVGRGAEIFLAIGLIGAGLLAIPILTSSSAYALSEAFGWKFGLSAQPGRAPQFYSVIAISTFVGMEMNFMGLSPIKALFWTAVINGLLAPILLVVIMIIANNKKIMGSRSNGFGINIIGWTTAVALALAGIAFISTWGKT